MPAEIYARVKAQEEATPWLTLSDGSKVQGFRVPPGSFRLQWNQESWGTKWNAFRERFSEKDPKSIRFATAWDPPVPVLAALAKRFPRHKIVIKSREPNMQINLTFTLQNGRLQCKDNRPEGRYMKSRGTRFTKKSPASMTDELLTQKLQELKRRSYSANEIIEPSNSAEKRAQVLAFGSKDFEGFSDLDDAVQELCREAIGVVMYMKPGFVAQEWVKSNGWSNAKVRQCNDCGRLHLIRAAASGAADVGQCTVPNENPHLEVANLH